VPDQGRGLYTPYPMRHTPVTVERPRWRVSAASLTDTFAAGASVEILNIIFPCTFRCDTVSC
jgi:hypothetical protein